MIDCVGFTPYLNLTICLILILFFSSTYVLLQQHHHSSKKLEYHKVKNCDYKNKSICQTIIIMSSLQFEFLYLFQPNLQFLT